MRGEKCLRGGLLQTYPATHFPTVDDHRSHFVSRLSVVHFERDSVILHRLGSSPPLHLRPHCVRPGALIRDIRDVRSAVPDVPGAVSDDMRSAAPDAHSALHDARGAPRGTCAAKLVARPPRRRGIAAMEAEGCQPEPDDDVEWKFLSSSDSDVVLGSSSDSDVVLGGTPAVPADGSDSGTATPDVRPGAVRPGAADETPRLGMPADADTDDSDGPGGVALGVVVPADTDTDHDGGGPAGPGGVTLCVGAESDPENPGGKGGEGGTGPRGTWLRQPWRPGQGGLPQWRRCSSPGSWWL